MSVPASWPPTRYSAPLSVDFPSDGDALLRLVDVAWRLPDGSPLVLDQWQRHLVRHLLEVYPEGHRRGGQLRYRQAFVSIPRQSGKSLLGSIFGLYGLLREAGALVIGLASSADQANIIFHRTLSVMKSHPSLARMADKLTETRGIATKDGSRYLIKAAKSSAVQGLDISVGLFDELHISPPELWSDAVNGTAARRNGIVIGLTTAGDDESVLLKSLYETAEKDPGERFGFFVYEAPEARMPTDTDELQEFILAANPAVAEGRLELETVLSDIASMAPADVVRYRLNRFTAAKAAFLPADVWQAAQRAETETFPDARPVVAIDRSPDWGYATMTVSTKVDGVTWTEVACSMVRPTMDRLVGACMAMARHAPTLFVVDGYALRDLGQELIKRGLNVRIATQGDVVTASSLFYAKTVQRKLRHAGDPLLANQVPRTVRKNIGEAFRISRADSSTEIDAVIATALGVLGAELDMPAASQLFTRRRADTATG